MRPNLLERPYRCTTDPRQPLLDVADLCRMFEEAEDASLDRAEGRRARPRLCRRQAAQRRRARRAVKKRGQPPVIDNRIKTKIDYLVGLEKQQRIKPRAFPRTPVHEEDADAATEALRYVAESEDYDDKRSAVWRNMLVEGAGGIRVYAEPSRAAHAVSHGLWAGAAAERRAMTSASSASPGTGCSVDPHSAEADFSDAAYLGVVMWMDYDDALALYPDAQRRARRRRCASAPSDTYDDKPKFSHWADRQAQARAHLPDLDQARRRVALRRVHQGRHPEVRSVAVRQRQGRERLRAGLPVGVCRSRQQPLRPGARDDHAAGRDQQAALEVAAPAQHQPGGLREGAVADIETFRQEAARADGVMEVAPGALHERSRSNSAPATTSPTAHFQLLQEAKNAHRRQGPERHRDGRPARARRSRPRAARSSPASRAA